VTNSTTHDSARREKDADIIIKLIQIQEPEGSFPVEAKKKIRKLLGNDSMFDRSLEALRFLENQNLAITIAVIAVLKHEYMDCHSLYEASLEKAHYYARQEIPDKNCYWAHQDERSFYCEVPDMAMGGSTAYQKEYWTPVAQEVHGYNGALAETADFASNTSGHVIPSALDETTQNRGRSQRASGSHGREDGAQFIDNMSEAGGGYDGDYRSTPATVDQYGQPSPHKKAAQQSHKRDRRHSSIVPEAPKGDRTGTSSQRESTRNEQYGRERRERRSHKESKEARCHKDSYGTEDMRAYVYWVTGALAR